MVSFIGLFTVHPYTKAVVELVPYAYDSIYYKNYVSDLGFADYIVSTGMIYVCIYIDFLLLTIPYLFVFMVIVQVISPQTLKVQSRKVKGFVPFWSIVILKQRIVRELKWAE